MTVAPFLAGLRYPGDRAVVVPYCDWQPERDLLDGRRHAGSDRPTSSKTPG